MLKALFHVDEVNKWRLALTNIRNLLADTEVRGVEVELVANGPAVVSYVRDAALGNELRALANEGVRFVACRNALRGNHIAEETLPDFVQVVPAGVSELIRRQSEGFAYVKP